jgi:hypothetical protein
VAAPAARLRLHLRQAAVRPAPQRCAGRDPGAPHRRSGLPATLGPVPGEPRRAARCRDLPGGSRPRVGRRPHLLGHGPAVPPRGSAGRPPGQGTAAPTPASGRAGRSGPGRLLRPAPGAARPPGAAGRPLAASRDGARLGGQPDARRVRRRRLVGGGRSAAGLARGGQRERRAGPGARAPRAPPSGGRGAGAHRPDAPGHRVRWDVADIAAHGLFLDLGPHGYNVFEVS